MSCYENIWHLLARSHQESILAHVHAHTTLNALFAINLVQCAILSNSVRIQISNSAFRTFTTGKEQLVLRHKILPGWSKFALKTRACFGQSPRFLIENKAVNGVVISTNEDLLNVILRRHGDFLRVKTGDDAVFIGS